MQNIKAYILSGSGEAREIQCRMSTLNKICDTESLSLTIVSDQSEKYLIICAHGCELK